MSDCLVIIDVQNGFLSDKTSDVPLKLKMLLQSRKFDHIVGTQFINKEGSPYIELMGWYGLMDDESRKVHNVVSDNCERIFKKGIYSCFTYEFEEFVAKNNIDKLYFAGIDTDCCVLKSAADCFERNIPFEVLINYCATNGGEDSQKAAIRVMERTIGKKNMNSVL